MIRAPVIAPAFPRVPRRASTGAPAPAPRLSTRSVGMLRQRESLVANEHSSQYARIGPNIGN